MLNALYEDAAVDCPSGCPDGQMPRLTAPEQPDDLQQHGDGSTHAGASEIAAANSSRRPDSTNARTAAVASDPTTAIQRTSAATEVAEAGIQFGQPTRAAWPRRRADRFVTRIRTAASV
jgi:hypothetical protein